MKSRSTIEIQNDFLALEEAGFVVRRCQPWHWKVSYEGSREEVNVWPSKGKYMLDGAEGANRYTDVVRAVLGTLMSHEDIHGQKEAQKAVDELRAGGLEGLIAKYKKD